MSWRALFRAALVKHTAPSLALVLCLLCSQLLLATHVHGDDLGHPPGHAHHGEGQDATEACTLCLLKATGHDESGPPPLAESRAKPSIRLATAEAPLSEPNGLQSLRTTQQARAPPERPPQP